MWHLKLFQSSGTHVSQEATTNAEYWRDTVSWPLIPTSTDVTDLPGTSNQTRIVSSTTPKPDLSPTSKVYPELRNLPAESPGHLRFSPGSATNLPTTSIISPVEMFSHVTSPSAIDVNRPLKLGQNASLEVSKLMSWHLCKCHAISCLWNGSGPMVQHYCYGDSIYIHPFACSKIFLEFILRASAPNSRRQNISMMWYLNLKFILKRFLNKRRVVCRWDLHSNSVGPWVHCLGRDLLNSQVLKHRELGICKNSGMGIFCPLPPEFCLPIHHLYFINIIF